MVDAHIPIYITCIVNHLHLSLSYVYCVFSIIQIYVTLRKIYDVMSRDGQKEKEAKVFLSHQNEADVYSCGRKSPLWCSGLVC